MTPYIITALVAYLLGCCSGGGTMWAIWHAQDYQGDDF